MNEFGAPLTAAIEKLSKKDATSTLIVVLIAFAAAAFGISIVASAPLSLLIALTGVTSFVTAIAVFIYCVRFKPERLQSEETVRMGMLLDWIKRADVDDEHRDIAAILLPVVMEGKTLKREAIAKPSEARDE